MPTQKKVHFYSDGLKLAAVLFLPDGPGPHPGIVLCHGFTCIKELILPDYARRFAAAGFAALTFDYRGFGESEGPRWRRSCSSSMRIAASCSGVALLPNSLSPSPKPT